MTRFLIYIQVLLLLFLSCCHRRGGNSHRNNTNVIEQNEREFARINRSNNTNTKMLTATEIFEKYNSAVFMVYTADAYQSYQGSGFFISNDGIAVSNYHVFESTYMGYEEIKLQDGKLYKIKEVLSKNREHDFIIFKVDIGDSRITSLPISNRIPKVGEKVYAIGSPHGLENTFSSGEISQLRGEKNELIQISTPIDHGSSGGALINEFGEVIGITTAGIESSGANLNFAININLIKEYLQ